MSLAFIFPGQGSQALGMLGEIGAAETLVRETFEEASDSAGLDLWRLSQDGPEERLNQTENTQPALLAASVALWRVWQARGGSQPTLLAGHSLGEYSALVAAGSIALADAARLVRDRGRFMQEAVPEGRGAMAAIIGLDDDAVTAICRQAAEDQVVAAANLNAPGQVVIAGDAEAVERAIALAGGAGARRAIPLAVSAPSHCALMRPAAERLAAALESVAIAAPRIPVLHNADVTPHAGAEAIRDALVRQLYQPVRWTETVQRLAAGGVTRAVECGPGRVLAGLVRRIERSLAVDNIDSPAGLDAALAGSD